MRSTAFFKLYKICILLHRCNLKIFAKNRFEKTAIFVKFQQKKIANVATFAKFYRPPSANIRKEPRGHRLARLLFYELPRTLSKFLEILDLGAPHMHEL